MLIAVVGGGLQGVEAVYLAQKAGWQTLVIDKNPNAPATGLSDRFMEFEFSPDHPYPPHYPEIDLILPAIEDDTVLSLLTTWSGKENILLVFDPEAYGITRSKLKSNDLFRNMGLPTPKPFPECGFPVVVKPDQSSGSRGVEMFDNPDDLASAMASGKHPGRLVMQEYVAGPSFSVEVMGHPGSYRAIQVTDLGMDKDRDCRRVEAPSRLSGINLRWFKDTAKAIAEKLGLTGIMDLEAMWHKDGLKLIEIDARLPSQTPMAVYWSTGINMVEILINLAIGKCLVLRTECERPVLLEHIRVTGPVIECLGEHIMTRDGPLTVKTGFFGADEAVTSYWPGKHQWVATMIFTGASRKKLYNKRRASYQKIADRPQNPIRRPFH